MTQAGSRQTLTQAPDVLAEKPCQKLGIARVDCSVGSTTPTQPKTSARCCLGAVRKERWPQATDLYRSLWSTTSGPAFFLQDATTVADCGLPSKHQAT